MKPNMFTKMCSMIVHGTQIGKQVCNYLGAPSSLLETGVIYTVSLSDGSFPVFRICVSRDWDEFIRQSNRQVMASGHTALTPSRPESSFPMPFWATNRQSIWRKLGPNNLSTLILSWLVNTDLNWRLRILVFWSLSGSACRHSWVVIAPEGLESKTLVCNTDFM